jgi:regulation of enolase protein 1 (concanavalin A-like superfamily)
MRRTGFYILILVVLVTLLTSISLACSKGSSTNPSAQTSAPATAGAQTSSSAAATGTATTSIPRPGGIPDIADMKLLPSYRFSIKNTLKEGEGAGLVSIIRSEWVRDSKSEHLKMEDDKGKVTMETISIGEKRWIWMGMGGMGWVEQPPQTAPAASSSLSSDFQSQLKKVQQDVAGSKARFDKKGTETVNNTRCTRYEFEYNMTTDMPDLQGGGTKKTDMRSSGEMWVADQSGLPAVMIKSINRAEISTAGKKSVAETEQNLTDIGAAITINPPEGAAQVPTAPAIPTGLPTRPPVTTTAVPPPTTAAVTPSPSATVPASTTASAPAPIFKDDFQGALKSQWVWTDPNDDATHSFTARPGFLRLTAPDGNDLTGFSNYDAPRLLVQRKGNFTLETLVEFDPQEDYQGAGLLVWQDEDSFLRLEFGFGGLGSGTKNVSFLRQVESNLELVNLVDLPDESKRIELRLTRNGDQFTAWYRPAGGDWQKIDSTEISLNSTVDVGIVQVTQAVSEISADFDYFKLFEK